MESAPVFKKPAARKNNIRKRPSGDGEDDGAEDKLSLATAKSGRKGSFHFSSSDGHKREAASEAAALAPGEFAYESERQVQTQSDGGATRVSEQETAFDRDARALREKALHQAEADVKQGGPANDGLYKGLNAYTDYKAGFRREHSVASEKAGGSHGPLRATAHIRWSVRFDYQPDICKDYKETGYCGYGDSCKFMHDRGDYKSGWQMDKEWDEKEKRRKERIALKDTSDGEEEAEEEEEDELPFACFICREPFVEPVMTKCKHYFCEHCALKHHARNKRCFVCNKVTDGVFNVAQAIVAKQKAAAKEEAAEKDKA